MDKDKYRRFECDACDTKKELPCIIFIPEEYSPPRVCLLSGDQWPKLNWTESFQLERLDK